MPPGSPHNLQAFILECQLLELDAYEFHAERHWKKGRQITPYRRWGHVLLIILNTIAASVFFSLLTNLNNHLYSIIAAGLSLVSSILAGLMLKFQPDENFHGHARLGMQFARIARKTRLLRHQVASKPINSSYIQGIIDIQDVTNTKDTTKDITKDISKDISSAWQQLEQHIEEFYQAREAAIPFIVGEKITSELHQKTNTKRKALLEALEQLNSHNTNTNTNTNNEPSVSST